MRQRAVLPAWLTPMTGEVAPALSIARLIWTRLAEHQPEAASSAGLTHGRPRSAGRRLAIIGPTEWLMEQGGDARLGIDPITGLNGYGCSHRPRPWAVTFASSTASSSSERGYLGAEAARRRMIAASFSDSAGTAVTAEAEQVRAALTRHFALADEHRRGPGGIGHRL